MDSKAVKELLRKLDIHYLTNRAEDLNVVKEWSNVLKDYSYTDVLEKIENHLQNEQFGAYYPKLYNLTKYLKTQTPTNDSDNFKEMQIICVKCKKGIAFDDYEKHHCRHNSIEYIVKKNLQYFNKETDIEKLFIMEEKEFNEKYENFIKKLYEVTTDLSEKKRLRNIILIKAGEEPEFTIQECMNI